MTVILSSITVGVALFLAGGVFRKVLDFMSRRFRQTVAPDGTFEWYAKMSWYGVFAGTMLLAGITAVGLVASRVLAEVYAY